MIINNSDLFVSISGNFSNGYLVKNKFSVLTDKKSNIILNNNVINNINSRLILDGNIDQNVEFEINELNFLPKIIIIIASMIFLEVLIETKVAYQFFLKS